MNDKEREKQVIKTSIIGISANLFLVLFKAIIGILSNSIAIILDAVNNLTDAISSIITIIGTKIAIKKPDKKHPFGHGRVEHLSAMIIAVIVSYAGLTSLIESVKKIMKPTTPKYTTISLIIIIVCIFVKIFLGLYFKKIGKKTKSDSLKNSGQDALMDSVISFSTLLAAIIFKMFNISIEAYLACIISVVIIKTGFDMLRETISEILGKRIDSTIAKEIKETVNSFEEVHGAYDLMLNSYGPTVLMGSIHIEVDDTMTAIEIDELTRKIIEKVLKKHKVLLLAIGIYSYNTKDKDISKIRKDIEEIVNKYEGVLQIHGFYLNKETNTINFDLIIDFEKKDREEIFKKIKKEIEKKYKNYKINMTLDIDASE